MKNNPSTGREEKSVGPQRIERKLTLHRMNFYDELKNVYIDTVDSLKNEINDKIFRKCYLLHFMIVGNVIHIFHKIEHLHP